MNNIFTYRIYFSFYNEFSKLLTHLESKYHVSIWKAGHSDELILKPLLKINILFKLE